MLVTVHVPVPWLVATVLHLHEGTAMIGADTCHTFFLAVYGGCPVSFVTQPGDTLLCCQHLFL
jgi:hypothetical protein